MAQHLGDLIGLALTGLFTGGVWAGRARDKCPAPYATFLYFGATDNFLFEKSSNQNKTVQIDVWAADVAGAETLADAVETAMLAHSLNSSPSMFTATQTSRQLAPPDIETRLVRIVLEFSVWFRP